MEPQARLGFVQHSSGFESTHLYWSLHDQLCLRVGRSDADVTGFADNHSRTINAHTIADRFSKKVQAAAGELVGSYLPALNAGDFTVRIALTRCSGEIQTAKMRA